MYGTEVSPEFISTVTDEVMAEVTAWQSRPLEPMYPVVFFDALRVKIREDAVVRNKAVYLALGAARRQPRHPGPVDREHRGRQVLDEGVQRPEDARRQRHPDRRHRRPQGHGRGAGRGVSGDHAADLHRAPDPQQPGLCQLEGSEGAGRSAPADLHGAQRRGGQAELDAFERGPWGAKFPTVVASWRRAWDERHSVLRFPAGGAPGDLHHQRSSRA